MKAPEKLYLPKRNKLPLEVVRGGEWYETDPQCMYGSVEYTRTDAFIEKACEFLDGCIFDYIDLTHANVDTFINVDNKRFIDEFRKYMEGE